MRRVALVSFLACLSALPIAASAAPIVVNVGASFDAAPISFSFDGGSFTYSATGDIFNPAAVQTSDDAAVRSFGGFLGLPVTPSTDFPGRGSGILTYGPGLTYASFPATTVIPYSNGDNYLGLRVTFGGLDYYGYAFTTNTTLNSYGYETSPNIAFTIDTNPAVPEPASWAMLIGGLGVIGGSMRRRKKLNSPLASRPIVTLPAPCPS